MPRNPEHPRSAALCPIPGSAAVLAHFLQPAPSRWAASSVSGRVTHGENTHTRGAWGRVIREQPDRLQVVSARWSPGSLLPRRAAAG